MNEPPESPLVIPNAYPDVVVVTYYVREAKPETGYWAPARVVDRPIIGWICSVGNAPFRDFHRNPADFRPVALGPETLFREKELASAYYERSTGRVFTFQGQVFGSVDEWIASDPAGAGD